jgi:outer membrane protein TolC
VTRNVVFVFKWATLAALALEGRAALGQRAQEQGVAPTQGFSLSEQEVERRVRSASPAVRAQRAAVATADAERDRASRAVVPDLQLSARYTRLSSVPEEFRRLSLSLPGVPMMDAVVFPQLLDQFVARAQVTFAVSDLFTRALPALHAAGQRAEAVRYEAQANEARAVLDAQAAYLAWLRARAAVSIARATRESFERQREDVVRRVTAGQIPLSQQLPLDVTLTSLRRQEIALEAGLRGAESALRAQLALGNEPLVATDESEEPVPLSATDARTRPELLALDANARALSSQSRAAAGSIAPSLSVTGGLDIAAPNPRAFAQSTIVPLATWDLSVQLSWSLAQVLDGEASLRVVSAQRRALEAQRDALARAIDAEIVATRADFEGSLRRLDEARRGLVAAEALATQRRGAFSAGAATATELTLAEADLLRQRLELADARLEARASRARLRFALGALHFDRPSPREAR